MKTNFIKKITFTILICFIIIVITREILPVFFEKSYDSNKFFYQSIVKLILLIATIILIKREFFFNLRYVFKNTILSVIISSVLLFVSLHYAFLKIKELNVAVSDFNHYSYLLQCLSTGFFEECFFRILIFGYICMVFKERSTKNYYRQVVLTSLLFSIVHLTNIFNREVDTTSVFNQIIFAFIIGIFLQSIFFRLNNIILNGVIHGLINYNGMLKSKLLNIVNNTDDSSAGDDFIQSLISALIIGLLVILPIAYFALKNKQNNLILE